MHVAIRNLVPGYLEFAREARRRRPQELRAVWERLYVSRHPDVFEAYFQAGEPPDFEATIEQVLAESDRFAGRAELLARVARDKAPRVAALFEAELCELPYVTMVGLHRFDGWMQDLDGSPTVFFAVEIFREPPWEQPHVVHETAHLVHAGVQSEPWDDEVIGLRLLLEGIAIASTYHLLPALPDWTHFNRDPREISEVLRRYQGALPEASGRLRELARSKDEQELARFFYPDWWRTVRDAPERVGYFVGWRAVERLGERGSLPELARLPPEEALERAEWALASLAKR